MATGPEEAKAKAEAEGDATHALAEEVRLLRRELTHLRAHRLVLIYQSVPRVLLFRMASGMAVGLGTVIGATLLLSVILWGLSQIEFIPIIGDWAARIAAEIGAAGTE